MFDKVLIAAQGPAVVRVSRTLHAHGIQSVSVQPEGVPDCLFNRSTQECLKIGEPVNPHDVRETALEIIAAAHQTKADAIHPGYCRGESYLALAEACQEQDMSFIGPTPDKLHSMKRRRLFSEQTHSASESTSLADKICDASNGQDTDTLGYGFRQYVDAITVDGTVITFIDCIGTENLPSFERMALVARTPSVGVDDSIWVDLEATVIGIKETMNLDGLLTVRFEQTPDGNFALASIIPGLAPNHAACELTTGLDLVEMQLETASDPNHASTRTLPKPRGYATCANVFALDPFNHFKEVTGRFRLLRNTGGPFVRIDEGYGIDDELNAHHPSLLATITTSGRTQPVAESRMKAALNELAFIGVPNTAAITRNSLLSNDGTCEKLDETQITTMIRQYVENKQTLDTAMMAAALLVTGSGSTSAKSSSESQTSKLGNWEMSTHAVSGMRW